MIMKRGMTNFNVNMYNEKIELLNEIIEYNIQFLQLGTYNYSCICKEADR